MDPLARPSIEGDLPACQGIRSLNMRSLGNRDRLFETESARLDHAEKLGVSVLEEGELDRIARTDRWILRRMPHRQLHEGEDAGASAYSSAIRVA